MQLFLILMTFIAGLLSEHKFCARDRDILLAGVFNYNEIVFAYRWENVDDLQKQIVWRFMIKDNSLVTIDEGLSVEQIFPGVPFFKAGFGLTPKCADNDLKCDIYKNLVFVFFQNKYKVYRFVNNIFTEELTDKDIPWGLKTRGEATDFKFNIPYISINGIAFVTGLEPRLYVVSGSSIYTSVADLTSSALEWTQLVPNDESLSNIMGAFVVSDHIVFNQKQSKDGLLLFYDQKGQQNKKSTVFEYFGCEGSSAVGEEVSKNNKKWSPDSSQEELNNNYAALIITFIIIAIIISNTSAAFFWLVVGTKRTDRTKI